MSKYSIVVPCYNEEETINIFYDAITPVLDGLKEKYEIIFINDGSRDKTEEVLRALAEKDKKVKVINFSRNFGQQAGIQAGLTESTGDAVIVIDVDLQDPVEAIPEMIEKWKAGYDVVHGKRLVRKGEKFLKKATSSMYTKFYGNITGLNIPKNCGDFKLFDRKVVDVIVSMPEKDRFLRGMVEWSGFKQTYVEFERNKRVAGTTKFNYKKMFKLATNGIVSNSNWPLSLSLKTGILGTVCSCIAFLTFIILLVCKISLPLVSWLFPTITLVASLGFMFNGLTNIYLARTYSEVQKRPNYIVREKINFDK